ncbi:MAG: small multi-drug export protein [Firmicutes bacterium]|nr:small multi-drug export protein [Bacillota bacterium]
MSFIENFFVNIFGGNVAIATVFIAILPVVELRGAIPFGASEKLFGSDALTIWQSFILSVLSCIFVASILLLLLRPIFEILKKIKYIRNFVNYLEEKFKNKAKKVTKLEPQVMDVSIVDKQAVKKQFLFVLVFSAVPIPLTGVWTASAIAVFLGLGFTKSLVALCIGTVISGLIIVGLVLLCGGYSTYIFHGFMIVAVVVILWIVVRGLVRRRRVRV